MKRLILSLVFLLASVPALAQNAPTTHNGKVRITSTAADALALGCSGVSPTSCTGGLKLGSIDIGNDSDTTITRLSAGNLGVEGNLLYRAGGTDVPVTDGGTGSSTASDARTALGVA